MGKGAMALNRGYGNARMDARMKLSVNNGEKRAPIRALNRYDNARTKRLAAFIAKEWASLLPFREPGLLAQVEAMRGGREIISVKERTCVRFFHRVRSCRSRLMPTVAKDQGSVAAVFPPVSHG